ncbi:MAG: ATP-dependent DNA helicase RecG [Rhodocyclaceae bacterium]|nr:ATP-dependent DNA helicase RecG [Rhodocyclaceae bacterium]
MTDKSVLAGLAPAKRERLEALGIRRESDLLLHLPLRYEDETRITPIAAAVPGLIAQFEARVLESRVETRRRRELVCRVADDSGELVLRFLNFYPSHLKALRAGVRLRFYGEVRGGFFGYELIHPRFRVVEEGEPLPSALTPVYPTTTGLTQGFLRRLIGSALEGCDGEETLPACVRARHALPSFAESIHALHRPPAGLSAASIEAWLRPYRRRLAFDELLAQQLSLRQAYAARRARAAPALAGDGRLIRQFLARLPFRLTAAQLRVWREIEADLAQESPMQRLLQGDVGSGKTVIAALAMLRALEAGYQAALMAPTEILAEQHYRKLAAWLSPMGVELAWLVGAQSKRTRQIIGDRLARGEVSLVVGTHALIEEEVEFARLALAIVDEQHRFGVRQRLALKQKGIETHQLAMSATPIPRTLAMSYYADLDVSVLDELPPGRNPVATKLVSASRRDEVIARLHACCQAGRQAYWVCPLIEESEALQLKTALETHALLREKLPDLAVGLVHGRLKAEEKAAVMEAFAAGKIQLLVATTVIEVGVDVPNATLMVIEHAERFGLAQLHQLRGRVGRGAAESTCILLYEAPLSATARQRLKIIYENHDGFEIARQDLLLRGPGEFIGSRQSGIPLLRFADLADEALIEAARETADEMLAQWPDSVARHLERWLAGREALLGA